MDKDLIRALLRLQQLDDEIARSGKDPDEKQATHRRSLLRFIPLSILDDYDHIRAAGRRAVVPLDDGYCTECQIRVPLYISDRVLYDQELERCSRCGTYLCAPGASAATEDPVTA